MEGSLDSILALVIAGRASLLMRPIHHAEKPTILCNSSIVVSQPYFFEQGSETSVLGEQPFDRSMRPRIHICRRTPMATGASARPSKRR
ncbi:MAG TPA: hypothetical protein VLC92_03385 [Rhodocyclaceae bacterium]|nr:hypothetical protein [Rhodocyclaceae bacterium]